MTEIDQPLTELCERAWKILYRLGEKTKANPRRTGTFDELITYRFENYRLDSKNRFLWVSIWLDGAKRPIFTVDEDGGVGSLDVVECAIALERFRQYTILDDLAEVKEA